MANYYRTVHIIVFMMEVPCWLKLRLVGAFCLRPKPQAVEKRKQVGIDCFPRIPLHSDVKL